jgi:hypothetical protein
MPTSGKDFRDIKTSFCFLDETGLIFDKKDKYFALGLVKCSCPEKIYNKIRKIRQRFNYNEEVKWSQLNSKVRFDVAMGIFNCFLNEDDVKFNCIILNKDELDFAKEYNNDLCKVYRSFTVSLLKLVAGKIPQEVLIVLADDYFTPEKLEIENTIKKFTNSHYQKFVVAGVCQINSKSSDLLQLTDLILGAIAYDLKRTEKIITVQNEYKRKFLNFVYQKLNIKESFFINSSRKTRNYVLSGDKIRATIFDCSRSRAKKYAKQKQAIAHDGQRLS